MGRLGFAAPPGFAACIFPSLRAGGPRLLDVAKKQPKKQVPLFERMPASVQALAKTAAKNTREEERKKWWAANNPNV